MNLLFNSVDVKPLHFHFPIFPVFIARVITFHCGFLPGTVAVSLLAMVRFERLAHVVFRWCTVVHIPRQESAWLGGGPWGGDGWGWKTWCSSNMFERHLSSDSRKAANCLMCHHRLSSSDRVSDNPVLSFFSLEKNDGEMNGHSDKATLHQSAIEPRGSTVMSASRCLLVEVCPKGKTTTTNKQTPPMQD